MKERNEPSSGDPGPTPIDQSTPASGTDSGEAATYIGGLSGPGASSPAASAAAARRSPVTATPPAEGITGEFASVFGPMLTVGSVLAERYEILQLLGQGGMGAVYKARDRQVDRLVAVKVIRPDMAANPAILQRFRQELVLARQVTHKNVIRIYDIGEAGGIKFITMEYVEGRDLRSLLNDSGKVPPEQAAFIVEQTAAGLQSAHAEGVIHRDLKPGNIMQDTSGRIVVMDFGLARTLGGDGMTQTGMMLGTMEYMSPEQAKADELDARSDIYTLGLIFFELLSGQVPFRSDSAIASLVMRTQERAVPVISVDPTIPPALSNIVSKCLERDPAQRYRTADDLIEDLRAWRGGASTRSVIVHPTFPEVTKTPVWKYIALAVLALAVVLGGLIGLQRWRASKAAPQQTLTLLVADFANETGDGVFDGTVEPAFSLALEGASFINSYARGQARKVVGQIKPGTTVMDEEGARLVAAREGISVVIGGTVAKSGDGYKIAARAVDAITGDVISSSEITADSKDKVLQTVASLAKNIRKALGDASPESAELAAAETYTSSSLEAAHYYAVAQEQRYAGNGEAAVKSYLKAIEIDPDFGSALAGLAAMYNNLGQQNLSIKYYKLAMEHADRMTEREKYRTRGGYYLAAMDPSHAVEEFSTLVKRYPADTMGYSSLGFAYYLNRDFQKALEEGRHALNIYPKYVPYRNNVALYALYAGDFDTALKEGQLVIQQNPAYIKGYSTVGLANVQLGKNADAAKTYDKMAQVSAAGASLATAGKGDLALFEGRIADAISLLKAGMDEDIKNNNKTAAAKKSVMIGEANLAVGNKAAALAALDQAIGLSRENVLFTAGRLYIEAGQEARANSLLADLEKHIESVPQANAKLLAGEMQLKRGRPQEAIRLFQQAQQLSDMWLVRFDLGRAYIQAGAFTEASSEIDRCIKRRGEATDVFFDEVQTIRFLPAVYYYDALVKEGLRSSGAVQALHTFLALKVKDSPELIAVEARRKLAAAQ